MYERIAERVMKMPIKRCTESRLEQGFTLIEIAIVILISSIIMMMLAQSYSLYSYNKKRQETLDHLDTIKSALEEYVNNHGHFPCPAIPTLQPNDPNYGREPARVGTDLAAGISGTCGLGGIIVANGNRDTGIDPDATIDRVLIGTLPYETIMNTDIDNNPLTPDPANPGTPDIKLYVQLRGNDGLDGWKNKITYAVSEELTWKDPAPPPAGTPPHEFQSNAGVISVKDENGQDVVPTVDIDTDPVAVDLVGTAQAVLISHGENGRWAYTAEGGHNGCVGFTLPLPPPPAAPTAPETTELANCPDVPNSVFLKGLRNLTDSRYNDDFTKVVIIPDPALWREDGNGGAYNTNPGFVGWGKDPTQTLDVNGAVIANELVAPKLCGNDAGGVATQDDCMDVEVFAGDQVNCSTLAGAPTGSVLVGIFNNFEIGGSTTPSDLCATPPAVPPPPGTSCLTDGTEYMRGMFSNGKIECCRFDNPASCRPVP